MGQNPAKVFPWPTPFGQSPDANVLNQAMAPPQAPTQNFLPLNVADPQKAATPAKPVTKTNPNPGSNLRGGPGGPNNYRNYF